MSAPPDERDDGRVVAEMDDVMRPPMLLPRFGASGRRSQGQTAQTVGQTPVQFDKSERRAMIGGAVSAALLAGMVMFLALAALIVILIIIWS